jgi:hypothetical protein
MTLPLSGSPISLSQVNTENGYTPSTIVSLDDTNVRSLATKLTGTIAMSDLQGKSNDGLTAAYYFDGSTNGVKINTFSSNSANLIFGSGDFTIEFWMKANTPQSQYAMIMDTSTNNTGTGVGVGQNLGTAGKLSFFPQGTVTGSLISANTVTDNTWRHIACVKFANTGMLFVNGIKEANSAVGAWSTVTNAYLANGQIGRSTYGGGSSSDNTYTGWLSNLRVVKNRAIYTANFTPPTRTLSPIPNTSLLTLKGSTVFDESGNNFPLTAKDALPTLTLTEIPSITPTVPVTISGSSTGTANVYTLSKSAGWDGNNGLVIVTVNTGVMLNAGSVGSFAMVIDDLFYGGLKLINKGNIVGKGGAGGAGGSSSAFTNAGGGAAGSSGGPALSVLGPVKINNTGRIAGGGGGGGGGGATTGIVSGLSQRSAGGGGGGGGIGVASGGAAGTGVNANGGAGGTSDTNVAASGGAGGVNGVTAGGGATGGGYGSSGGTGDTGNGNNLKPAGGAGGAAGTAISGVSKVTFIARGTINGAESG